MSPILFPRQRCPSCEGTLNKVGECPRCAARTGQDKAIKPFLDQVYPKGEKRG